ncbi:MAG TPA: hypothetical protein VN788_00140 [Verrucomicrobiae bacterium]|nr:hypothetical protein [Verrucomicrobiae bacterium]
MPRIGRSHSGSPLAFRRRGLEKCSLHELGRPRARVGNPNTGIPEVVVQPLYDIYFVAPGTALPKLTLFTVQQGQQYNSGGVAAFNKGPGHTNIVQPGMLESSYTFIVRALSVYVQALQGQAHPNLHPEDLNNFLSSFSRFEINHKSYFDGILGWLPAAGGPTVSGFGTLTAPASMWVAGNGTPQSGNMYKIPGGQTILPQENFDFIIDPTGNAGGNPSTLAAAGNPAGVPGAGLSAWARLDGTLTRVAS